MASDDKQVMDGVLARLIEQDADLQAFIQEAKPNDLWLYDVDTKSEYLSHAFWTLLGYYEEAPISRAPFIFSDYAENLCSLIAKAIAEPKKNHTDSILYLNRHGALVPFKCVVYGVPDAQGTVKQVIGAHLKIDIGVPEDIGALKANRREISGFENVRDKNITSTGLNPEGTPQPGSELFQLLIAVSQSLGSALHLVGRNWNIEFSSTQNSKDDSAALTFDELFAHLPADAIETVRTNCTHAFAGRRTEFELVIHPGHESFHIYPLYDFYGNINHVLCIVENVAEQHSYLDALKQSEAHLKVATQLAKIGYWELDIATGVFTFNEQFIKILGVTPEYFGGVQVPAKRYADEFLLDEDKSIVQEETRMAIEANDAGYSRYVEHRFIHKSGEIRYLAVRYFVVRNSKGDVIKTVGANQDITERKKAEQSLKKLIEKTSDQNSRLRDFSFIISHNIRSSVANLISLSELLTEEPLNTRFVDMIADTANNLDKTIKNVSELLNFENDVGTQTKIICYLREVIDRVLNLNKTLIEERNIDIQVYISANTQVLSFPAYVESIFYNLISNAIKYGVNESSRRIVVGQQQCQEGIHVYVQDFGNGLDLEKSGEKLFQLGVRLHSCNSGQGLGLFMTRHQVEAMDGKIWVESELNKGTRFNVLFTS